MGSAIDHKEKYTYADYLLWPEEERWELINGYPYNMSPAPSRKHQAVLGQLFRKMGDFFDKLPCQIYVAPFDVRLSEDHSDDHLIENVVQPDISVFCKKDRLDEKGAIGAPDIAVEILSPSTSNKDLKTKLLLYQKFKVGEYWIVDPEKETIEILVLDDQGKYNPGRVYDNKESLVSANYPSLSIDLKDLFERISA